jgi:hypothetical protein
MTCRRDLRIQRTPPVRGRAGERRHAMSTWFGRWFGYGLGTAAGKAIFGEERRRDDAERAPIRAQTEEEIRADEKRYDEEAKQLEAQAAAERASK